MKLEKFIRIITSDFKPDFRELVEQLAGVINRNTEIVYNALQNRINLRDNIACTVKELIITVDENGIPTTNTSFKLDNLITRVEGYTVLTVINALDSTTYPPGAVFVTAQQTNNTTINNVVINKVTGLTAGVPYKIKLLAFFV